MLTDPFFFIKLPIDANRQQTIYELYKGLYDY